MERIVAYPRVVAEKISQHNYLTEESGIVHGEVVQIKAQAVWGEHNWPVSVHVTVPPGHAVTPHMGDCLKIVISRDDRSPEEIARG